MVFECSMLTVRPAAGELIDCDMPSRDKTNRLLIRKGSLPD